MPISAPGGVGSTWSKQWKRKDRLLEGAGVEGHKRNLGCAQKVFQNRESSIREVPDESLKKV